MRFARPGGVFCFCLCASFAFLIASRRTIDDPALVVLTAVGVTFGLAVGEFITGCFDRRGDDGVVGVEARKDVTGVVGLDLDGLNALFVCTRVLDTEDGICGLVRWVNRLFIVDVVVDFVTCGVFRADSSCRSLASRRVSLVLPERLKDSVCAGITFAVGGVVTAVNSLAVPKLTSRGSLLPSSVR